MTTNVRRAICVGRDLDAERLERYLPGNYHVVGPYIPGDESDRADDRASRTHSFLIEGEDDAGWTLGAYVIPRLASGLIGCQEVEA